MPCENADALKKLEKILQIQQSYTFIFFHNNSTCSLLKSSFFHRYLGFYFCFIYYLRFEKKRKIHTKYLRFKNMQEKLERKGTFSVALQIHFRQKKTRIPTQTGLRSDIAVLQIKLMSTSVTFQAIKRPTRVFLVVKLVKSRRICFLLFETEIS